MSTNSELAKRLRKACNGHPHALIPWPHRILHEAADEIERLTKAAAAREAPAVTLEAVLSCVKDASELWCQVNKRQPFGDIEREAVGSAACLIKNKLTALYSQPPASVGEQQDETAEILADPDAMAAFREGVASLDRGEGVDWEDLKKELEPAPTPLPAGDDEVAWPTEPGVWERPFTGGVLRCLFAWHARPTPKRTGVIHAVAEWFKDGWIVMDPKDCPCGGWRRVAPHSQVAALTKERDEAVAEVDGLNEWNASLLAQLQAAEQRGEAVDRRWNELQKFVKSKAQRVHYANQETWGFSKAISKVLNEMHELSSPASPAAASVARRGTRDER